MYNGKSNLAFGVHKGFPKEVTLEQCLNGE